MRRALQTIVALAIAALTPVFAQSVEVVVHPDSNVYTITKDELSKIFLKRLRTWSDRTPAVPVDQVPDSPARQEFTRLVHERSVVNVEVYWKRLIFSGRAVPPKEVDDDESVLEFVRNNPGAVGYVSESARLTGVRKLKVTD